MNDNATGSQEKEWLAKKQPVEMCLDDLKKNVTTLQGFNNKIILLFLGYKKNKKIW